MKKYKFFIKDYDLNIITIEQGKDTVDISMDDFVGNFYLYRNFPFANYFLPKVAAYFSPMFVYKNNSCAFLITQMRPRKLSANPNTYLPWSYLITFVNLSQQKILESILFFGEAQILSEDLHELYVPKMNKDLLNPSNLLGFVNGNVSDVFADQSILLYTDATFGRVVDSIHETMLNTFMKHSTDVSFFVEEDREHKISQQEIFEKFRTYFYEDKVVKLADLDEFSVSVHSKPITFSQLAKSYLEESVSDE